MNKTFIISIALIVSLFWSISTFGQDIISVRYNVTPNIMLDLIDKYPEKKENIEKKIKSESMKYVDFILIDNELIQIYWGHDSSLMGVKIYSKDKVYTLSIENDLTEESVKLEPDTVFFEKIDTADTLYHYELTETNAMPLLIRLTDSLANDSFSRKSSINDYPEIGFVIDYRMFPKEFVFGRPKAFMTYDSLKVIKSNPPISKEEYEELILKIKSKKKRKEIMDLIAERKPVANKVYSK